MTASLSTTEPSEGVLLLTLNRPAKLNALDNSLLAQLFDAIEAADADAATRAVVLTGAGQAFSAGADIAGFESHLLAGPDAAVTHFLRPGHRVTRRIEQARVPIIAAVNGLAYGGGCELVEACHLAVAARSATFAKSEIAIGILPTFGGTQRLWRHTGRKRAIELILTGEPFGSEDALAWGLVNNVVDDERLLEVAVGLARRIAARPRAAVSAALVAIQRGTDAPIDQGLALEEQALREIALDPDAREGVRAFLEKRAPSTR